MRVTTAFRRLLGLSGIVVRGVSFGDDAVVVEVGLRRGRLECPLCLFSTRSRYDTRTVSATWRHLDFGRWRVLLRAPGLRRLRCPTHGVRVEAVPFARHRAGFTRDFEDLVAFLATKTDKTTITRISRLDWDSVGRMCARVVADGLDPGRLDGLVNIGVDEVSWRRHHRYLTLVADHTGKKIVWGAPGKDTATLDKFFAELGTERSAALAAVSMDMGPAFAKSVATHAPTAVRCIGPFHAVKLVTDALDTVRRATWNELGKLPDQGAAKKFKGARWAPLKRPENLTDDQNTTLRQLRRRGGDLWGPTTSRRRSGRSSPATSTPTRPPSSSTAGARGLAAPDSPRSSRSPRPSASSATASSPPSALRSTMVGSKDSTTTSA